MTDRAFDPVEDKSNPFAQIMEAPAASPAGAPDDDADNPFAKIMARPAPATSATGAFVRGAVRGTAPAIGSLPAIGAGAEAGGELGSFLGPIGAAGGALIGGAAGGLGAGYAIGKAQDWALSKLPDSWTEALGLSERQEKLDAKYHGTASFLGGLLPYAVTMRPGLAPRAALPENATALQRIMAHPATAHVFGGAIMGGLELGQEMAHGEAPDWTRIAVSTGFGVVFNRPTRIGESLTSIGQRPVLRLVGRELPTAPTGAPAAGEPVTPAAAEATAGAVPPAAAAPAPTGPTVTGADFRAEMTERDRFGRPFPAGTAPDVEAIHAGVGRRNPPTVADAADLGVMGPGITEDTFQGSHQRSEAAEQTARQNKQLEDSILGEPVAENIHALVRRMHPELFAEYDQLLGQREEFHRAVDSLENPSDEEIAAASPDEREALMERRQAHEEGRGETPELVQAREHLRTTNFALWDLSDQIRAAYRRAAEAGGHETVEPEPSPRQGATLLPTEPGAPTPAPEPAGATTRAATEPPAPPRPRTIEEQRDFIRQDVTRQLIRAGRPKEEAEAAGALIAARYETRANLFNGARGTPEELYRAEGAEILGPGMRPSQPVASRVSKPRNINEEKLSLIPFLAHRGGISASDRMIADLRAIVGTKPYPGLIRSNGGMTLDRAREAAAEAGYIVNEGRGGTENRGGGTSTIRTLLDAVNDESRGRKRYRPGMEPKAGELDPDYEEHLREQAEGELRQPKTIDYGNSQDAWMEPAASIREAESSAAHLDKIIPAIEVGDSKKANGWLNLVAQNLRSAYRERRITERTEQSLPLSEMDQALAGAVESSRGLQEAIGTGDVAKVRSAIADFRATIAGLADRVDGFMGGRELYQHETGMAPAAKIAGEGEASYNSPRTKIFRAHQRDDIGKIHAWSSWTPEAETAQAYTENPGFGGPNIRTADVDLSKVLKVNNNSRPGLRQLAEDLGFEDPEDVADRWWGQNIRYPWEEIESLRKAMKNSKYDWIQYEDDFPDGATTLVPLRDFDLKNQSQPLLRNVTARGRSGRPLQSAGFNPAADQQILDAGYQRATAPPAAKIAGEGGSRAASKARRFRGPPIVYHQTDAWDGGDLLPLETRLGKKAAVQEFLRRWPLATRDQALEDIGMIYTTDSSLGGGQGNKVLAIDARKVPGLEWFMQPEETDGGWVADRIPAEAILGHADDPKVIAKIRAIEGQPESAPPAAKIAGEEGLGMRLKPSDIEGVSVPHEAIETGATAYKLPITNNEGKEIGRLNFGLLSPPGQKHVVQVLGSQINQGERGKGLGIAAYKKLADYALSTGQELWSDRTVEPEAQRMYEALRKRGYTVEEQDPDVEPYRAQYKVTAGPSAPPAAKIAGEGTHELYQRQRPTEPEEIHDLPGIHIGPNFLSTNELYQINAYHGSPHDFDRFDFSKIGTGEGAQAYGSGGYFAGNENVAKSYRDMFAQGRMTQAVSTTRDGDKWAVWVGGKKDAQFPTQQEAFAHADEVAKRVTEPGVGHMYQVSINADPERFLDWDKPLSQQSRHVQDALRGLGVELKPFDDGTFPPGPTGHRIIDNLGAGLTRTSADISRDLHAAGIPGIKYLDQGSRDAGDGTRNYVVFDDSLVEITHKDGTPVTGKDREDIVNELKQGGRGGARGGIVLNPRGAPGRDWLGEESVKPILRLTRDANASTFIHESGHQFLAELLRDAEHEAAPEQLKADAQTVLKWLGAESPEKLQRRHHEKFATGFEQYLREGTAPSPGLARVFAQFKQWLLNIYQTIRGLGQPINEDIRGVFDRLLAEEPQRTVIAPEREAPKSMGDVHAEDAAMAAPEHADPVEARLDFERRERQIRSPHEPEIERSSPGPSEPGGEAGGQAGAASEVQSGGEQPATQPGGGGVRTGNEPQLPGVNPSAAQGNRVAGRGAAAARPAGEPDSRAYLDDQPLAPGPADSLAGRDTFNVGKSGNIRTENITSVEQFANAIEEAKDRIPGTDEVMTDGQVRDAAESMGFDPDTLTVDKLARAFGGVKDLNKKVLAFRMAVRDQAERVGDLMRRIRDEGDSDELVAEYAKERERFDMFMTVLSSVTTEWGRAGRSFRNLEGWDEVRNVALSEMVKNRTGRTLFQLKMEAKLGAALDSPAKVAKFLRDAQKRSAGGMLLEYWINGLISGPSTHITYMVGNQVLTLQKAVPETLLASAIGSARSAMGRQGPRAYAGEVGAGLKGMVQSLPAATQAALEAMRTGMPTLLPGETARPLMPFFGDTALTIAKSLTNDPVTWREVGADLYGLMRGVRDGVVSGAALVKAGVPGAPLVGLQYSPLGQIPDIAIRGVPAVPLGSVIRLPGRSVAAIHSFFRTMNYLREGAAEAYRVASDEGLSGNAFASRIGQVRQNPTPEQMERWRSGATQATLMAEGGEFVKALSRLTNAKANLPFIGEIAPLKFIDPFVHIGANVINQAIVQRTPLGILSSEIRADLMGRNGNIAQDFATARMLAGTAMGLVFGGLAMEGYATGSGPSEPAKAAMWRLAGYQPHSVRIGDMWYQVNRLGPIGMLLSTTADMYDVAHEASQGELLTAAAHLQHAITQNILDESFMRGPADLIKAVEDPGRYGEGYLKNFVSSFVPFSVGMFQIARAADPYSRQARDVMDSIRQKVPGLSESLFPRIDIWGQPIPNPQALGAAGLTAVYMSKISNDPVNRAMLDLGISPVKLERKIRNVDLTDEEYDDFARVAGRMTKMRLDVIVNSPDWHTWPNPIRNDVISEVIKQSREAARGMMMMRYPHIPRDAVEERRNAKLNDELERIH